MTKAVISNKIYLNADPVLISELSKKLTYRIELIRDSSGRFNTVETIRNYSIPAKGVIAIPQGRFDLIPEGYEIIDKRTNIEAHFPSPLIQLRESQQPVLDEWEDSGILNAKVGWGKSYTALWIAFKLGQKTLVVAHNTMLRDQWMKDIRLLFGIEPGIIGSGAFDIDADIVVGNVQTLTKHATELADKFGTIILDEMHHCPASTFSAIIGASKARYRIGLSGTMERKDKKHVLFKDFFGSIVVKPPQSNTINPKIRIIKSGRKLKQGATWVQKVNDLMEDREYQEFIAAIALTQITKGKKVLLIADRVEFLERVHRLIGSASILVTGQSADFDAREQAKIDIEGPNKHCICGSRQIFAEGISINILDTLILSCPMSSEILLEQLIGRIMREYPGKTIAEVFDINFAGHAEKTQNNIRLAFYLMKGWDISMV